MIDKEILIKALAGEHVQFHRTFPALFAELVKITSWLIDPTPLERAYCVVHDIHKYPTCDHCGENRKWVNTKKIFSATCGKKKCQYIQRAQSTHVTKSNQTTEEKDREIQKRKSTLISKYGSTESIWFLILQDPRDPFFLSVPLVAIRVECGLPVDNFYSLINTPVRTKH